MAERRKDSVVAREVQVALPRELSGPVNKQLAIAFAHFLRANFGVAIDVAIHTGRTRKEKKDQPHAHLLLTTRRVSDEGEIGAKTTELDNIRTGRVCVEQIRAQWADLCNAALTEAGIESQVDHRSYQRQGTAQEGAHVPRGALELEAQG